MEKTIVFDGAGGGTDNNLLAALIPAIMNKQGIDPSVLALMGNRGGNGGFGNDLFGILLLFILMGRGGLWGNGMNGGGCGMMSNGQGGVIPFVQNDANTGVIMQSVQRNGFDIQTLATALNTSSDAVLAAINALGTQICNLNAAMGTNTNQLLTAIMQGDNGIISQLCSCCCDLKQLIAQYGAENRLATCEQTNTLQGAINGVTVGQERGFSNLGFETQKQTCSIEKSIADSTEKILAGQRAAEMREMQRDLAAKDAKIAEQAVVINNAQQTSVFGQMIASAVNPLIAGQNALQSDVNGIKCKLPETFSVSYQPFTTIPNCVAAQYGLYGGYPAAVGTGFWG